MCSSDLACNASTATQRTCREAEAGYASAAGDNGREACEAGISFSSGSGWASCSLCENCGAGLAERRVRPVAAHGDHHVPRGHLAQRRRDLEGREPWASVRIARIGHAGALRALDVDGVARLFDTFSDFIGGKFDWSFLYHFFLFIKFDFFLLWCSQSLAFETFT